MIINNIDDIWPFVQHKDEIIRIEKPGYTVLDYVYVDENTFDSPQAMECRGIKFNSDGTILARPFAKFFNYGERNTDLPIEYPHVVMEKLDGSMIHPALVNGELLFMTRKGHTDVSKKAEGYFLRRYAYFNFMMDWMRRNFTPIFEYIGPTNRIVLRYETHRLVLVAIRNNVTGEYIDYHVMKDIAEKYGVEVVSTVEGFDSVKDVENFIEHTRDLVDLEGYVVSFDHGLRVKIKALEYLTKHRALDDMSSKKKVVALCMQGFADDIMPVLDEADKQELTNFRRQLNTYADSKVFTAKCLADVYELQRKQFALKKAPTIDPPWLVGVIFNVMDGKPARPAVLKNMQKHWDELPIEWRGV